MTETARRVREISEPLRKLPRVRLTLLLLLAATLSGAPVLIGYAGLDYLGPGTGLVSGAPLLEAFTSWLPFLMILGSLTPLLTIFSVPEKIGIGRYRKRISALLVALGGGGSAMIMLSNEPKMHDPAWIIGYPAGTLACAIGLATAAQYIGSAVPQWKQLGSGRQTVTPLVCVILLIAILRPLQGLLSPMSMWQAGSKVIIIGSEILLVIGTFYLMINRLWLSVRLARAITRGSRD